MNTDSLSTFPDQKEGYICPSCRLLFAITPHMGGNGVVCPGCNKLLTVPNPEDGITAQNTNQVRYKQAGLTSVDKLAEAYRTERQWEKQRHDQMMQIESQDKELRWMVPLALVAIVLLGGLGYVLLNTSDKKPVMVANPAAVTEEKQEEKAEEKAEIAVFEHSNPEMVKKLEEYLATFAAAKTVDDLLPVVRQTDDLRAKMINFYGGEKVDQYDLNELKSSSDVNQIPGYISVTFEDKEFNIKQALVKYDGTFALDWESYIAYSDLTWEKMGELKPVEPFVMRVTLSIKDFYLGDFSDERKWQSVSLNSPNEEGTIYGYVERRTAAEQLVSNFGVTTSNYDITVRARYPENATRDDQIEIIEVINNSWLVEDKK